MHILVYAHKTWLSSKLKDNDMLDDMNNNNTHTHTHKRTHTNAQHYTVGGAGSCS